jgi:hypothetical protein
LMILEGRLNNPTSFRRPEYG